MFTKTGLALITCVILIASATAGPTPPTNPADNSQLKRTPPGAENLACNNNVDPAITRVTLTKGAAPGQLQISYDITNLGTAAWHDPTPHEAGVDLEVSAGGHTPGYRESHELPTDLAPGSANKLTYTTPTETFVWALPPGNPFRVDNPNTHLIVRITYGPDVLLDNNLCNDDANKRNNIVRADNAALDSFIRGTATSIDVSLRPVTLIRKRL